jgi:hypothetical protein
MHDLHTLVRLNDAANVKSNSRGDTHRREVEKLERALLRAHNALADAYAALHMLGLDSNSLLSHQLRDALTR